MPGGAARVDLLGARVAPFLARWLHNTIHEKLLKLPDSVAVYPTHGGGSFCSAAPAGNREIPIVTVCAAGMRATIAGSILHRDGRKNIQVVDEHGTPAWIERGYPSATGEE